jgi:hypothetical protein
MHMPGKVTGTTKRVARILPEGRTDESATNWQGGPLSICANATVPLSAPRVFKDLERVFIVPVAMFLWHLLPGQRTAALHYCRLRTHQLPFFFGATGLRRQAP